MTAPEPTPYRHVQFALQASNLLWDEQLFSNVQFRQDWAIAVIDALIVLGGKDIEYIESEIVNADDHSRAHVSAITPARIIEIEASVARSSNGIAMKIAPETYSRRGLRRMRISDLRGDFVDEVPDVHGVGVVLEFIDRSVELGLDRSRAGARTVHQQQALAALLPSFLEDLERPKY